MQGRRLGLARGEGTVMRELRYGPLWALLGLGLALRVVASVWYAPSVLQWVDALRFARLSPRGLFSDFWMPAGYPVLLKVLHALSASLAFTIGVQHLLGVLAGLLCFLAVRRAGAPRWLALLPAGVAVLSGDHIFLEHLVMADAFFLFMVVAGLWAAIRGLAPAVDLRWLAAGSAALAASGLVRSLGVALPLVLAVCAVTCARGTRRGLARALAAAALPAIVVLACYVGVANLAGSYSGLTDMGGWNLYGRVAPLADCTRFTPPAGTRALCEVTPTWQRPGPFGYLWVGTSIGRRTFRPLRPETGARPGAFARAAILGQPGDYVRAVVKDLVRYAEPDVGTVRPGSGEGKDLVSFGYRDPAVEAMLTRGLGAWYTGTVVHARHLKALGDYQNLFRLTGVPIIALFLLALAGMALGRGVARTGAFLFGLSAFGLYLIPTATLTYDLRYGVPAQTVLAMAGVIGAWALVSREGSVRTGGDPSDDAERVATSGSPVAARDASSAEPTLR